MTYRTIDLQVSVPKVQETGTLLSQYQSRLAAESRAQEAASVKETETARKRMEKAESKVSPHLSKESYSGRQFVGKRQAEKPENDKSAEEPHPYKGRHVDLSL